MARPPKDPAIVARALALVDQGYPPQEAAEELAQEGITLSWRTIYRAKEERERARTQPAGAHAAALEPATVARWIPRSDVVTLLRAILEAVRPFTGAFEATYKVIEAASEGPAPRTVRPAPRRRAVALSRSPARGVRRAVLSFPS